MYIIKKKVTSKTKNIMHAPQNEQNGQEEQKEEDHDNNNNILAKEIDSWGNFEYALREENRLLF
jgi:hypothetical protein